MTTARWTIEHDEATGVWRASASHTGEIMETADIVGLLAAVASSQTGKPSGVVMAEYVAAEIAGWIDEAEQLRDEASTARLDAAAFKDAYREHVS